MNECKHDWRSHGYDPDWCDKCGIDRIAYLENTLRDERQKVANIINAYETNGNYNNAAKEMYKIAKAIDQSVKQK